MGGMMTDEEYLRARGWFSYMDDWMDPARPPPGVDVVAISTAKAVDIQVKRDQDCTEFAMHHKFAARSGG